MRVGAADSMRAESIVDAARAKESPGELSVGGEWGVPGGPGDPGDPGDPGECGDSGESGDPGVPGGRGESGESGECDEPDDGEPWILEPATCATLAWRSPAELPAPMPDHELAALAVLREGEPFTHLEFGFAPCTDPLAVRARERH